MQTTICPQFHRNHYTVCSDKSARFLTSIVIDWFNIFPKFQKYVKAADNTFLERWIGRGGPAAWPPRSPDINPLDFFLWGYVKICLEVFKSLQHLKG